MATTVLRVRLVGVDRVDIMYDQPDVSDEGELVELVVSTLAQDSGCCALHTVTGSSYSSAAASQRSKWHRAVQCCDGGRAHGPAVSDGFYAMVARLQF
jgi:hypothetical protein